MEQEVSKVGQSRDEPLSSPTESIDNSVGDVNERFAFVAEEQRIPRVHFSKALKSSPGLVRRRSPALVREPHLEKCRPNRPLNL